MRALLHSTLVAALRYLYDNTFLRHGALFRKYLLPAGDLYGFLSSIKRNADQ